MDPRQTRMHLHRIIDWKGIVAGNTEDMANAKIGEPIEGVGRDGGSHLARMANLLVIIHMIRLGRRWAGSSVCLLTLIAINSATHFIAD